LQRIGVNAALVRQVGRAVITMGVQAMPFGKDRVTARTMGGNEVWSNTYPSDWHFKLCQIAPLIQKALMQDDMPLKHSPQTRLDFVTGKGATLKYNAVIKHATLTGIGIKRQMWITDYAVKRSKKYTRKGHPAACMCDALPSLPGWSGNDRSILPDHRRMSSRVCVCLHAPPPSMLSQALLGGVILKKESGRCIDNVPSEAREQALHPAAYMCVNPPFTCRMER